MNLTITMKQAGAGDLGYLLHKNPANLQTFPMSFGSAHVFYSEVGDERTTAVLMLDVDPIALIRKSKSGAETSGFALSQYVNDRPYCASSFLSVAIAQVFGSALAGRSRERQELADQAICLEATVSVVWSHSGPAFIESLFTPLGYEVELSGAPLDVKFPEWGESPYYKLKLKATTRLSDLLSHLYVLIPVLDNDKHYSIDKAEVEKLLRHGEGWLAAHRLKEVIVSRYLRHSRRLTRSALEQLAEEAVEGEEEEVAAGEEEKLEERISLNTLRQQAVLDALKKCGARKVIDLGCGEGKLLKILLEDKGFEHVSGMDVSSRALSRLAKRLRLDETLQPSVPGRTSRTGCTVFQGSLTYRDDRLQGYDAATCVEVIEHLDKDRLEAFARVVFAEAKPGVVVVTTPNIEYNVRFEKLPAGKLRHSDHRFEFTRQEFKDWCESIALQHGYQVSFQPIGELDDEVGAPTQMGVFTR
ncbi:MAG: 3' terminal RNA ribose 2'-O-methyltransferase Hen1 [Candidatus Obscuribacter sp.]|nr:3' terminal RNA ribose 2'-O-methyltransferase Hen1 [Candidatus Obscuribacter sp.]